MNEWHIYEFCKNADGFHDLKELERIDRIKEQFPHAGTSVILEGLAEYRLWLARGE